MALTQKSHQLDGVLEIQAWRQRKSRPAPAALGGSDRCPHEVNEVKVEVQTDAVGEPHGFVSLSI